MERHSTGIRVVDGVDDGVLEWNSCVIVRVCIEFGLRFGEGLDHVWTGADRTLFCKVYFAVGIGINDDEERIPQYARQGSHRFFRINGYILAVSGDVVEFEHRFRTRRFCEGTFNGFLDSFAGDRGAVGEFNVFDLEGPGHLVVRDFPAFSDPWFCIHLVIEVNETFTDAVTHDLPAEVVVGRFEAVCEVRNADSQGVLRTFGGIAGVTAAAGKTKSHESSCCKEGTFFVNRFHRVRFLSGK